MIQVHRAKLLLLALFAFALPVTARTGAQQTEGNAEPLRIFLRAGEKTHGPGQHDHPLFLSDWSELLTERGAQVEGALRFPTDDELARADVLVMYAAEAGTIRGAERARFDAFLARGGGLVVVHDAVCGEEPAYFMEKAGGAWEHGVAKWLEGEVGLYFDEAPHPITRGIPHFDLDDEIYYEMNLSPKARVLASSFHDVFTISPQLWVVDEGTHRAFVTLQGHEHATFSHPAFRTLLLRGIAWAGRRDVDSFTTESELAQLRYPPGGPLAPEVAHEAHVLHEDFELSLVAAEPLVVNPISCNWDASGRLWVAITPGYPFKQESSGVAAHDEIVILTDADGDGRMDGSTVFADGLDLVTSFVFHLDGVIATAAPDILWLRDTDGDGVCDVREVLYTGFGFGDTHAVMSNLRWGPDGWVYATQGYSGGASRDIRSPYRDREDAREPVSYGHVPNGLFRFRADGSAIETVSAYGSNTWGLDFTPGGELFFTMANGSHLRHVLASEEALGRTRLGNARSWRDVTDHKDARRISEATRAPYVQIDYVGGFTAAAGSTIYSAGAWPDEYAGNHFVCEPTVNLVHRDVLERDANSFRASRPRETEFLASTDPWFRPVDTRTGPDGALYVLDFYNQAAVHNDTRGPEHGPTNAAVRPDRDRHHGRIWRVQHREAKAAGPEEDFQVALRRDRRWLEAGDERAFVVDSGTDARHARTLLRSAQARGLRGGGPDGFPGELATALRFGSPSVRRAAAAAVALLPPDELPQLCGLLSAITLNDSDPRVRTATLETLVRAASAGPPGPVTTPAELTAAWPSHPDDVTRSIHLTLVEGDPVAHLQAVFEARRAGGDASLDALARRCLERAAAGGDPARTVSALLVLSVARLQAAVGMAEHLRAFERALPADFRFPATGGAAARALGELFEWHGMDPFVARELLPLVARLEDPGALEDAVAALSAQALSVVEDPDAALGERLSSLDALLAVPATRAAAVAAAERFLDTYFDPATQGRVIERLAELAEPAADAALVAAFSRLSNSPRSAIFDGLIARPEGARAFLDAIEAGDVQAGELGPNRVFRLRHYPAPAIAARAEALFAERLGAETAAIDDWIEQHLPEMLAEGDVANGAELFRANCTVCHTIDLLEDPGGKVGPELSGMGAHGREHLLPFILRPNLSVEAAYLEYVAETVDGTFASGVLTSDAPDAITLAGSAGEVRVPRDELDSLRSTGRSPMPTGFESLGAEGLRDLLAFLCQGYEDYRIVSLQGVMTSTTNALYDLRRDAKPMRFVRLGVIEAGGVPYELLDPARTTSGNNALVLKGGLAPDWDSKVKMPQRVEVPLGFPLQRLHVLGGIAAWGHPYLGKNQPIVRWTWVYADGQEEVVILRDGDEFADWIGRHDVPGSEYAEGVLAPGSVGQVRRFALDPSRPDVAVQTLVLESFDNEMAPTFLALTAQLRGVSEPAGDASARELSRPRVLIVGGGTSHDYDRWFDESLRATLADAGGIGSGEIEYTDRTWEIAPRLATLDVLVLANNQPLEGAELRDALFAFVDSGGGLLVLHAAAWHNWTDWPAYNRDLVGGGARGHGPYGAFDVLRAEDPHPLLEGLPDRFEVRDELYRFEVDPSGTPITVLASGVATGGSERYPVAFTIDRPGARIACVTLGHDGEAHGHPAFQRLLRNALGWLAEGGD